METSKNSLAKGTFRGQVLLYLIVGAWNTVFGYACFSGIYYVLHGRISYSYMIAYTVSSTVTIFVAFLGYKHLVFRTKGNFLRECMRCYTVYAGATIGGFLLLTALVEGAGLSAYIAQAIVTFLSVACSFFGHRNYSFRP